MSSTGPKQLEFHAEYSHLPMTAEHAKYIGEARIACAVLDDSDNTRVLTQEGFLTTLGRAWKAKGGEGASVDGKPAFLRAKNLEPFILNDLIESTTTIEFVPLRGHGYQGRAIGFKACRSLSQNKHR